MAFSPHTIKLDEHWNFVINGDGNFAQLQGAEATAQNVANEVKLFTNDAYYSKDEGIDWFGIQLGKPLSRSATTVALRSAAEKVDQVQEVQSATVDSFDPEIRTLRASLKVITTEGEEINVAV